MSYYELLLISLVLFLISRKFKTVNEIFLGNEGAAFIYVISAIGSWFFFIIFLILNYWELVLNNQEKLQS